MFILKIRDNVDMTTNQNIQEKKIEIRLSVIRLDFILSLTFCIENTCSWQKVFKCELFKLLVSLLQF